jgi:hypothetical protein
VLDRKGRPVPHAGIKVYQWQKFNRGDGTRMSPEPIATGTTDGEGEFVLPNQPCPTFTTERGFTLRPNPFGRTKIVGLNGLLLVRVHARRQTDYLWMEIFDFTREYHLGNTAVAMHEVKTWLPEHGAPVCQIELEGTTKGKTVTLKWEHGRSHDIVGYNVYRGVSGDYGYTRVASNLRDFKWTDNLLQVNPYFSKTYRYVVTAVSGGKKESAFSTSYTTPILNEVHGVDVDSTDRRIVADAYYFHILAQEPEGSWAFLSDTFWGGHGMIQRAGAQLLPEDVAVDSQDRIVALNAPDKWNKLTGFTIFDSDGGWIATIGAAPNGGEAPEGEDDPQDGEGEDDPQDGEGKDDPQDGEGEFKEPKGIAVGPDDVIVVADTGNHRVQVFDRDGKFVRMFGTRGDGDGELESPEGVGVAADGTIYVADTGNDRVQTFTPEGEFIEVLRQYELVPKEGAVDAEDKPTSDKPTEDKPTEDKPTSDKPTSDKPTSDKPTSEMEKKYSPLAMPGASDVHVGADGTIYIAATGGNLILVLPKGDVTKTWTINNAGGGLNKPVGVSVDSKGNIIIADSGNKRVAVYKAEDREDLDP